MKPEIPFTSPKMGLDLNHLRCTIIRAPSIFRSLETSSKWSDAVIAQLTAHFDDRPTGYHREIPANMIRVSGSHHQNHITHEGAHGACRSDN